MIRKLLLLSTFITITAFSQTVYDLIQPVNLKQDGITEVVLSDLFYSENYNVELLSNQNINAWLNEAGDSIFFQPKDDFTGLELITFKLGMNEYEIPVKLIKAKSCLFTYKPEPSDKQINLFGQFNSWNRQSLSMTDLNNDGILEIEIPLDPGRYEYKFFVDGKELIDPENPVRVPNGLGDFNSVLVIEEEASDKMFLHILGKDMYEKELRLRFYYEDIDRINIVKPESVIALIDNQRFPAEQIIINGREISLILNREMLEGSHSIRIAVNKKGRHSNIQTIQLHKGAVAGTDNERTLHDQIIYSIMIDRFNNGDTSNDNPIMHDSLFTPANYQGGDLKGIIDKIEAGYFSELGVNTFWISPIVDNTNNAYREYPEPHRFYTGYHGYWPVSSTKVEEKFGDMDLARRLVEVAHANDIHILWDFISNHIHQEHPFWKEHRNWFGELNLPNGRRNLRLWDEYRLTTWFEPYMPSYDYVSSIDALEFMTDNAVWWLTVTGADGFRHDAVKHVPNEFWRMLTKKTKTRIEIPLNRKLFQIGETFGGIDLINSYVNNGQLNAQFNFNLYDVAIPTFLDENASFKLLDYQMQKSFQVFGYNNLMGNIMDSHDKIRYMAYADGDLIINEGTAKEVAWTDPPQVNNNSSYNKLILHLTYILTIPGVPIIYYGDEIGMTGSADPDNRRMMRFDDQLSEIERRTRQEVSRLIHIRKDHPALRYGDFLTLLADENIYAYIRSDMNERLLTVLNKSTSDKKLVLTLPATYNLSTADDLVSGKAYEIKNNNISLGVEAINYLILKLN